MSSSSVTTPSQSQSISVKSSSESWDDAVDILSYKYYGKVKAGTTENYGYAGQKNYKFIGYYIEQYIGYYIEQYIGYIGYAKESCVSGKTLKLLSSLNLLWRIQVVKCTVWHQVEQVGNEADHLRKFMIT